MSDFRTNTGTRAPASINEILEGLTGYISTTTGSGGGTLVLTADSVYQQYFTGGTTHIVTLPVTSTLVLGRQFQIVNNSTGAVTVNSSGGNLVQTVASNSSAIITCISLSGTGAASWSVLVAMPPLTDAHIFVGNVSNAATDVAMTGQASISNAGAVTLDNAAVIAKVLTAYSKGAGTISASSTILQALQIADGNAFVGLHGYLTTATGSGGGTLVLTNASAYQQYFTGVLTHIVTLPVTSTLALGWQYQFVNNSTGAVTVNSSGGNLVTTVAASSSAVVTCVGVAGTGASDWNVLVAFPPLTSAHIFVGNVSNQATDVAMSGEAGISNAGSVTLSNAAVIAKLLTGFTSGAGTISATDSILSAIQKLSGDLQNLPAISNLLSGFVSGAGTVAATDSILGAVQKLDGNINYQMLAGGTGGYATLLTFTPTPSTTITSGTYDDIAGVTNQTITVPISGTYDIFARTEVYQPIAGGSAYRTFQFQALIDGVTAVPFPSSYATTDGTANPMTTSTEMGQVTLAAGTHTIRLQAKMTGGSGSNLTVYGDWAVRVSAMGAGINGLEVQTSTLGGDFTITQLWGAGAVADTGYSCTVNTLANERVQVSLTTDVYNSTSGTGIVLFAYQIDGAAFIRMGDVGIIDSNSEHPVTCSFMTAPLTAGSHTIKIQAAKIVSSGTFTPIIYSYTPGMSVTRFKSNGLGAGSITTTSTLGGDTSVTSVYPTYQDSGLSCAVTTVANEQVHLSLAGFTYPQTNANGLYWAYSVDGAAEVFIGACFSYPIETQNVGSSVMTTALTAGSHTIKIRVCKSGAAAGTTIFGSSCKLCVIQYRGGLIPIQQSGVTKVDNPTFQNYLGGAIVTANGTGADITFPNAALGGFSDMLTFSPTGTAITTSGSWGDVTGMVNKTFVTPVSGVHLLAMHITGFAQTNQADFSVRLIFDEGTANQQTVSMDRLETSPTATWQSTANFAKVTLAAGSHTVKPQWYRDYGSGTSSTAAPWMLTIQGQGTGINGLEVIESALASNWTITGTYVASPGGGMTQVSTIQCLVNTLEGERVEVSWNSSHMSGANGVVIGYQVDGTTAIPVLYESTTGWKPSSFKVFTIPLSAGQHTIKLMAARGSTDTAYIAGNVNNSLYEAVFRVTRYKSFGIGAGTIVTSANLASGFVVTQEQPTHQDVTGLSTTITTIANEQVNVTLNADIYNGNSGIGWIQVYYQVDSATDVMITYASLIASGIANVNAAFTTPALTAGQHTIKIRAAKQTFTGTITPTFQNSTTQFTGLQITQYRGGLIPIKNNAVDIVTTPSDLDFTSDFAVTNPSALKAQIDLNCLDLTTALKVQPLADATYQLGDTAKNFKSLYLDNGGTDGGAVFFNAGVASFLKSAADGATLDVGGFTAITVAGTVDGVDISAHDHSSGTAQTRLAAKDRRRMALDKKVANDAAAADATAEHIFFQAQDAVTVTKVFYLPDAALTADNTDYATLTVYRRDASGGTQAAIASVATTAGGSGSWTAFDGVDLGALSNTAIAAGQVITWEITKANSGVVVPAGTMQVEYTVD